MDVNSKLDLKEQMNISINLMIDSLHMLDCDDIGAALQMWQVAINKAKETKIRMVSVANSLNQ
ncbi:hypothetical protein EV694_1935 [Volucribacter psittacicida]|uniref:Uncharacterized protein n=1 Tax=Volucribacter psittacicida TaxID=203482 RepID=A0A4R1FQQ7_9PAST|nr:hypothetical protein [Volucribacter psittacicida]TCJ95932.1 hypothetical protein EV694_1935 [Volucribacter psittacicida]